MFKMNDDGILNVTLPEGKTQQEILELAKAEIDTDFETQLYGKDVRVNGRITTALAMWLGHKLAHITHSVSLFDPKENRYVTVIGH